MLLKLQIVCQFCHQICKGKDTLQNHMRGKHGLGKKLVCLMCGESFKWRSTLANHKKRCTKMLEATIEINKDKDKEYSFPRTDQ